MRMRTLFNLLEDADEIVVLFSRVETPEQMVSLLERLKKQGAPELLETIQSLRLSLQAIMEETLEIGGSLSDGTEEDNFTDDLKEDEDLLEGLGDENEIPPTKAEVPETKS